MYLRFEQLGHLSHHKIHLLRSLVDVLLKRFEHLIYHRGVEGGSGGGGSGSVTVVVTLAPDSAS